MKSTLLSLLACLTPQETEAPLSSEWTLVPSGVEEALHDVHFSDENHGWTVGYGNGMVLRTTDGGLTWTQAARLEEIYFEQIQFVDADTGWLCGELGTVLRTTDGGTTWEDVRPPVEDLLREPFEFTDPPEGVIALYYAMQFSSPLHGFVTGSLRNTRTGTTSTVLFRTSDGGESWTREETAWNGMLFEVQMFPEDGAGVAIGRTLYQSEDSGASWVSMEAPLNANQARGLSFLDPSTGWSCSFDGKVLFTSTGGMEWTQVQVTPNRLRSLVFLDENTGFAVGDANHGPGVLWSSTDGGRSWKDIGGEVPDLHRIIRTAGATIAVGKRGTILRRPHR